MAGFLILAGTLILVSTAWQQTYWWAFHPAPSDWIAISDRTYSGVLSEANQSVVIPLQDLQYAHRLRLLNFLTNDTPVTLTLRNWNDSVVLQLANWTGNGEFWPTSLELRAPLAHYEQPGTPTLTIAREAGDVSFSIRVMIQGYVPVLPAPPPWSLFVTGYAFSVGLICAGFVIIEDVLRDIRQGRV
jgi:hypothetical protein